MINYIQIFNGITHHDVIFRFDKGITAIHGRNGRGKSLIQEFIRFALFGSSALRGKTSDYPKNLEVRLSFTLNGEEFIINRTLNDCYINGVVGTTACNKAIVNLLGYDLSIFDMGNCAKQFEITKLGKMKPSERKQAVDKLIGLDIIDSLIKEIKEESTKLSGYVEGLSNIKEPEPLCLAPTIADMTLEETKEEISKREKIRGLNVLIEINKTEEPTPFVEEEPTKPFGDKSKSQRKDYLIKNKPNKPKCPDKEKSYYLEQKERFNCWKKFDGIEEPKEKEDFVDKELDKWKKFKEWERCVKVDCPKCGENFSPSGLKKVTEPKSDLSYVENQKRLIDFWKNKPDCPKSDLNPDEIEQGIKEWDLYEKETYLIDSFEKELESLSNEVSYEEWLKYEEILLNYINRKANYERELSCYEKMTRLIEERDSIKISEHTLDELEDNKLNLIKNRCYLDNYNLELERYERNKKELNEKKARLDSLKSAIRGLNNVKTRIKSSITPNLTRVASELCYEMTEGEIREIKISEDFDISVDGRNISLLSGSEEAVANLSIRLALGRILTHKVLNVFIGDEIDAAMDDNRALLVSESLKKLTNQINQIILISHKKIEADNYIFI